MAQADVYKNGPTSVTAASHLSPFFKQVCPAFLTETHRSVKTRGPLSKQALPTPRKPCQSSHCEKEPLWRLPEVPAKSSNPLCRLVTGTVFLQVCMRCKPMSLSFVGAGSHHKTSSNSARFCFETAQSHNPIAWRPRNSR